MRTIYLATIAAVLLGALPSSSSAEETMDRTQIDEANRRLEALQKEADAAGMAEMYTEEAILLPSGGPRADGREAIRAFWAEKLAAGGADVRLTTEELVPIARDLAYEIGRYTTRPKNGAPVSGHYVVLWKRVDGAWKLHVDIFNERE